MRDTNVLFGSAAGFIARRSRFLFPRAQSKRPVSHEALWLMPRVGAPVPSPDGKWVVFPSPSRHTTKRISRPISGSAPTDRSAPPRRITSTKAAESGVAWSADSRRIAFAPKRERDEANQIYSARPRRRR